MSVCARADLTPAPHRRTLCPHLPSRTFRPERCTARFGEPRPHLVRSSRPTRGGDRTLRPHLNHSDNFVAPPGPTDIPVAIHAPSASCNRENSGRKTFGRASVTFAQTGTSVANHSGTDGWCCSTCGRHRGCRVGACARPLAATARAVSAGGRRAPRVSRVEQPGGGHRPGRSSRAASRQCRTARAGDASAHQAARRIQLRPQSRSRRVEHTRRKPAGGVCRPPGLPASGHHTGSGRVIVPGARRHGPRNRLHPVPLGRDAPLDSAPAPTRIRSEGAVAPVSRCDPSAHGPRVSSARALNILVGDREHHVTTDLVVRSTRPAPAGPPRLVCGSPYPLPRASLP